MNWIQLRLEGVSFLRQNFGHSKRMYDKIKQHKTTPIKDRKHHDREAKQTKKQTTEEKMSVRMNELLM